jgi:hypothetical protein
LRAAVESAAFEEHYRSAVGTSMFQQRFTQKEIEPQTIDLERLKGVFYEQDFTFLLLFVVLIPFIAKHHIVCK